MRQFVLLAIIIVPLLCGCSAVVVSTENPSVLIAGTSNTAPSIAPLQIAAQSKDKSTTYYSPQGLKYYLPTGVIHIDIGWSGGDWAVKVTPIYRPDRTAPSYNLDTHDNQLFDDDTVFAVDSNGLLQTLNSTTQDQTISSIGSLISAAGSFLTFGATLGAAGAVHGFDGANIPLYSSYHADFTPDDIKGINGAETTICVTNGPLDNPKPPPDTTMFEIKIERLFPDAEESSGEGRTIEPDSKSGRFKLDGIAVRTPVPYVVTISQKNPKAPDTVQQTYVMLPDIKHNYLFPVNRRYLVSTTTKLMLASGMVTSIERNKPSMVAGIVGIPKTILSALSPIPLSVKQNQANYYQAVDSQLKAQADIQKGQ